MAEPLQQSKVRGVVDIVFLIDATGSMQPFIDGLKANVKTFIDGLVNPGPNNPSPVKDWRARVVGYRDVEEDGSAWYEDATFVRDVGALKAQLDALVAKGGGDEPESLLDALYKVSTMGQTEKAAPESPSTWRYRSDAARVVIVFTDASYKPTMALPEARGGGFDDVANAVMANRIILSLFAPQLDCYFKLSELDKSEYQPLVDAAGKPITLDEFTRDSRSFEETLKQLAKSVSKSTQTEVL